MCVYDRGKKKASSFELICFYLEGKKESTKKEASGKKKKTTGKNVLISKECPLFIFSATTFHCFSITVFGRNCFRRGNSGLVFTYHHPDCFGEVYEQVTCTGRQSCRHSYAQHTSPRAAVVSGTREGGCMCAMRRGEVPFAPTWLLYILLEMSGLVTGQSLQVT